MRIGHIAPLIYTPGKLEYFSFIRGGTGTDYHQNPQFHQFPGGEVIMYWNAYDFNECSNDTIKLYSVCGDRGLTWTDPQVYMADRPSGAPYFVLLLRLRDTNTTLMFITPTLRDEIKVDENRRVAIIGSNYFKCRSRFFLRRSLDGGRSFDHGKELPYLEITGGKELPGGGCYGAAHEVIQLQSGRIVAVFYYMDPERSDTKAKKQHYMAACLLSDDEGRSWKRGGEILVDTPRGVMEPQIVETAPDRLFCLFRTKGGYLYQTVSNDGGQAWSVSAPSPLPSPESMPRMIKLQSGNLLVVWNNVSSVTQQPRHPLVAAVSCDGGGSWSTPKIIADETGVNQLSNHNMIQLDDGRILVSISHYHATRPMTSDLDMAIFDEEWLLRG